jgi:hypothetical protein
MASRSRLSSSSPFLFAVEVEERRRMETAFAQPYAEVRRCAGVRCKSEP